MEFREIQPERLLAVFLGASTFEESPNLADGSAFYNSANDLRNYLRNIYAVPRKNIKWLFDDSHSPSDQLNELARFLSERCAALKVEGTPAEDLLIYYVGHGLFAREQYCLAIRATKENNEAFSSIRGADLAGVVKEYARLLRRFLIFDCCFSAAIYKEFQFQTPPMTIARAQVIRELPLKGTSLLCSSNAEDPSFVSSRLGRTMFSDALIMSLANGDISLGNPMSFSELGDLVRENLKTKYDGSWARPEVHSPDQREGDIAQLPMFPNAAYHSSGGLEQKKQVKVRAEQEKRARDQAEQERLERHKLAKAELAELELRQLMLHEESTGKNSRKTTNNISVLEALVRLVPQSAGAYTNLALAEYRAGKLQQAIRHYEQAKALGFSLRTITEQPREFKNEPEPAARDVNERAEQEQVEREKEAEQEKNEKAQAEYERLEREKQDQAEAEQERLEREQKERTAKLGQQLYQKLTSEDLMGEERIQRLRTVLELSPDHMQAMRDLAAALHGVKRDYEAAEYIKCAIHMGLRDEAALREYAEIQTSIKNREIEQEEFLKDEGRQRLEHERVEQEAKAQAEREWLEREKNEKAKARLKQVRQDAEQRLEQDKQQAEQKRLEREQTRPRSEEQRQRNLEEAEDEQQLQMLDKTWEAETVKRQTELSRALVNQLSSKKEVAESPFIKQLKANLHEWLSKRPPGFEYRQIQRREKQQAEASRAFNSWLQAKRKG